VYYKAASSENPKTRLSNQTKPTRGGTEGLMSFLFLHFLDYPVEKVSGNHRKAKQI
jgi:hypothetical protein